MAGDAAEFLDAWALQRESKEPLTHDQAAALADDWFADASDNGIGRAELDEAAGGDLARYLLRVFGEAAPGSDFPTAAS